MEPASSTDLGFTHLAQPGEDGWTLLLLHATGGDEHQLVGLAGTLSPRSGVLSPRGKVLENGVTRRWFRRFSPTDLDIEDLQARGDELARFVHDAAGAYALDAGRIVAVGYSNGANVAVDLLLRHPTLLRGAVLLRPMLPYPPPSQPDLAGRDVLVLAGTADPFAPTAMTEELVRVLGDAGAAVTTGMYPAGHEVTRDDIDDATAWVTRLVQGA